MNGSEHFAEAERLLAKHTEIVGLIESQNLSALGYLSTANALTVAGGLVAKAQAHATLALAAAQEGSK